MSHIRFHRRLGIISLFSGRLLVSTGIAFCLAASSAWAQNAASGTINGQVTDPQGAAIAGAEVKLIDKATNSIKTYTTNEAGRFDILNINPGAYDVSVSRSGFSESKLTNQNIEVGTTLNLTITLQLGAASTIVEVSAGATAELQTTSATVGSTVSGLQLQSLPAVGRDANTFILLQPGVSPGGNVAGTVADQSTFQLDGGNNSSDMDGGNGSYTLNSGQITGSTGGTPSGVMPTPIETIEEFKVGTVGQNADFNGSGGGQVQMVTKRGTNSAHGAVYEYLLSSAVGANTWKNNHTALGNLDYTPLPKTHQNRYGASLGGKIIPKFMGGAWYAFFNYEVRDFPQATTNERLVPTALLRLGVVQAQNSNNVWTAYNLNPYPVTYNGVTYQPAVCPGGACDPRGIGLNKDVAQIWSTLPLPNDPTYGDTYNTQGYNATVLIPQETHQYTARIDHDFNEKWHLMTSYRYFILRQNTTNQTDLSATGTQTATAPRVQKPSYFVTGLTTTISPTLTNDFHYNYVRNFWQWGTDGAPPQIAGIPAALEIGGESANNSSYGGGVNALQPYNVNAQSVRQRFWDGQDHIFRDDLNWIKGNHLFQFGGIFQHNFNYHVRDDNGVTVFNNPTYVIGGSTTGLNFTANNNAYLPASLASSSLANFENYYTEVLGIVSLPQVLYTRSGSNLALQPVGTNLFDKVNIPYYNVYFSDTWHARKDLTIVYGLGYQIEMPPTEESGKQVLLVDQAGNPLSTSAYLNTRNQQALAGSVYNPNLGFALINNVSGSPTYPYHPFYGGVSPRFAFAWNPNFTDGFLGKLFDGNKTVIRGGYNRVYGRLNGVAQVLVPLLGLGLAQAAQCIGASSNGQCLGAAGVTAQTAFRIGTDGNVAPLPSVSQTLSQPYYPGQGGNAAAGDVSLVDPNFRPDRSDVFTLSVQRQINQKNSIEVGYIGRIIRNELQLISLNSVPINLTLNGQSFANAWSNIFQQSTSGSAIQTQPFFESALGGPNSAYCAGFASCTAAVASKQKGQLAATNPQVYTLWTTLANTSSWTLGRTLPDSAPQQTGNIFMDTSLGWGNYNALYVSYTMREWHDVTVKSNFTWSRSMGTAAYAQSTSTESVVNPFNLAAAYGPQGFDYRFVYTMAMVYNPKWFLHSNSSFVRTALGGWNFSPLFTAQSGAPLQVGVGSNCQAFGESNCADSGVAPENALFTGPYTQGNSLHQNVTGSGGIGTTQNPATGGTGLNYFSNPAAAYAGFRAPILGFDVQDGGVGILRNFPLWNLDLQVTKDFRIPLREGMGLTFSAQFFNVLNHFQPGTPTLTYSTPSSFGTVTSASTAAAGNPRTIEFGLRLHF
jgi:Carboxypeptidase regulatory-like domain